MWGCDLVIGFKPPRAGSKPVLSGWSTLAVHVQILFKRCWWFAWSWETFWWIKHCLFAFYGTTHTQFRSFCLQFLSSFCSLTLVVGELSFRHLYVPQPRRWLAQKRLRRGARRDSEVWVSTAIGLFGSGWTVWGCNDLQSQNKCIPCWFVTETCKCKAGQVLGAINAPRSPQLLHVSSSNDLVAWFPHHCISSVFSLSLVAAER